MMTVNILKTVNIPQHSNVLKCFRFKHFGKPRTFWSLWASNYSFLIEPAMYQKQYYTMVS